MPASSKAVAFQAAVTLIHRGLQEFEPGADEARAVVILMDALKVMEQAAPCLLVEMLAGKTPFHGGSARETMKRRQAEAAPDVRAVRPEVPEEISVIIKRTLNTDPSMRFPTAGYLRRALDSALELIDAVSQTDGRFATRADEEGVI
jgi:serine/threonine protein kinase